jgi:Flp pilus assembly pilin Flp
MIGYSSNPGGTPKTLEGRGLSSGTVSAIALAEPEMIDRQGGGVSMNYLRSKLKDRKGQGMTEYIIIAILIAIVVLVAVKTLGTSVKSKFSEATKSVDALGK